MPEITLNAEQSELIAAAQEPVTVLNSHGDVVGRLGGRNFTAKEIEIARDAHRKDDRCRTTAEVFAHLLVLSEAEKQKGARLEQAEIDAILRDL